MILSEFIFIFILFSMLITLYIILPDVAIMLLFTALVMPLLFFHHIFIRHAADDVLPVPLPAILFFDY